MTRSPSTFIVIAVMLTLDAIAQTSSLPSLQQIQQMPVEDRRAFYRNLKAGNANDLLVPLTQGLTDGDAIVRRNATGKAAFLIARLNQFAASGKPASLEPSNLQNLTEALTKSLSDSDREVRGFTVSALAYSGAPSPKTESMLLGRLPHEDEELRGKSSAPWPRQDMTLPT